MKERIRPGRKDIDDIFALTPMQEGMLFHYLKDPEVGNYIEQLSLRISGHIDEELFKKAWNFVIETNDMLRSVFRWEKVERPVQVILKNHMPRLLKYDFTTLEVEESEQQLKEIKKKHRKAKFNLQEVPLRVTLCKIEEDQYEMIISNHHILYDGWSNGIIFQEFFSAYNELSKGKEPAKIVKTKFKEFIKWNLNQDKNKQDEFWKTYLQGFDTSTVLPIKIKPTEKEKAKETESFEVILKETLIEKLENFISKNRVTLASFFYTCWGILLQKYCNNQDVIFGTTVSGRSAPIKGIENMVGLFINTIPLRVTTEAGEKIKALIHKVNNVLQVREKYECTSLVDIKKNSSLEDREEFFDSIIIIENYPVVIHDQLIPGNPPSSLQLHSYEIVEMTNYDLTLGILLDNDFKFCFNYNTTVYKKADILRLSHHLTNIIKNILKDVDNDVSGIEILTDQEKRRLLVDFNDTRADYPNDKTVIELFEAQVENTPFNTAVIFEDEQLTYSQLNKRSDQLTGFLEARGVTPGQIVGIMAEPSLEAIVGILAILKAGAAYLPIDPDYPRERIRFMLTDSSAKILVTTRDLSKEIEFEAAPPSSHLHRTPAPATSLAYIIYTSGTTGKPKGVMIEHRNLVNVLTWFGKTYGLTSGIRVLQMTNFTFDPSVEQTFSTLLYGSTLYVINRMLRVNIEELYRYIEKHRLHIINVVPTLLRELLTERPRLKSIRLLVAGGERLEDSLKERLLEKRYSLYNHYGPTETTIEVLTSQCSHEPVILGKPIHNTRAYILSKTNHLQPIGTPGELCISGVGLARGYLNQPELTAEKFEAHELHKKNNEKFLRGGPGGAIFSKSAPPGRQRQKIYNTGDLACWKPDGNIEFLGRIDHQVKIRGYRIEPGEIENQLLKHEIVKEVVVLALEYETKQKYLCAYIVPHSSHALRSLSSFEFREYLTGTLPNYMVPDHYVMLDKLPRTAAAKIDRRALPVPERTTGNKYTPPRSPLEKKLVEIWAGILDINKEKIGIDTDFFLLGGHSLKATLLAARIHKELDIKISLKEIFQKSTIRKLSETMRGMIPHRRAAPESVEKKEYYTLSSAQKRLYILQQMETKSTVYNMPGVFALAGAPDKEKLADAFAKLIKRHESLRTSFHLVEEPVQRIHRKVEFEVKLLDLNPLFPDHGSLIDGFIKPFDLSQAPLFRLGIIMMADTVDRRPGILVIDMHHITADGISHGVLVKDFMGLYGKQALAPLKIQYKDFSAWQNSREEKQSIRNQGEYWKEQFQGEIPVLNLPLDFIRPGVKNFAGSHIGFILNREETQALKKIALEENVTLFMILIALYNVFLAKISSQEEIVVGTPGSGRRHPDLEQIIGMFVNTLVLKNYPQGEKTFREFLKELSLRTLEALENQDYQYEELVDAVAINRDPGRNPLFDTMFVFQNQETPGVEIDGLKLEPYAYERKTAKFDLTLEAFAAGEKLAFEFEYCTKLFLPETIQRFITYFKKVISTVLETPGVKISGISILPGEEKKSILSLFNDTAAEYPQYKSIHELFAEQVEKKPDHITIIGPNSGVGTRFIASDPGKQNVHLTYNQLNEKTGQLAHLLIETGIKPDTIVGITGECSVEMIVGILGILKAGGAYLPIDPDYPEERINYMLKDSSAKILLTSDAINRVPTPHQPSCHPSGSSNLAYIIYTSGSTGKPKGVVVEHTQLLNFIYHMYYCFNEDFNWYDYCLSLTSISFDVSVCEIFLPLSFGARLVLLPRQKRYDPIELCEVIVREKITFTYLPPALLKEVNHQLQTHGGRIMLNKMLVGVEPIRDEVLEDYMSLNPRMRIINGYGPTEATICATTYNYRSHSPEGKIVPIGMPLSNNRIVLLDQTNHIVPIGVPGELCISGTGLARGYLNNPELTAEKFDQDFWDYQDYQDDNNQKLLRGVPDASRGGFLEKSPPGRRRQKIYKTGDLGRWLPDGNIEFRGRIDHQVKIRGYRIELGEIENQLLKHEEIKEAVVLARKYESGDKYLCAYIVGIKGVVPPLKEYLSRTLPGYMIPDYFVQLENIPLTSNGKINRNALPAPRTKPVGQYAPPQTETEKIVARAWKDVLELEEISIHDNIFDIGGNSLIIIRLAGKLKEILKIDIPVVDMFRFPTIYSFVRNLDREKQEDSISPMDSPRGIVATAAANTDIAVIGMAARFPGAKNIHQYLENLQKGVESITFFTEEELEEAALSPELLKDPNYIKAQGILEDADCFDAMFFDYTPMEAEVMDPQMRVFHECAWEALENGGYDPGTFNGAIGIYAGASSGFYWKMLALFSGKGSELGEFSAANLADSNYLSTRLAYKFDFRGPANIVQTACSTSLVAIHQACRAILSGECHMALAGGVSAADLKKQGYMYRQGMVLSPDGHCRAFDANANGTVGGSGVGIVLLKPLQKAVTDRDHIYALVKGTATNNDGKQRAGYTAPGIEGQAAVIRTAMEVARVHPETIGYVETHGTGTGLGDPVEIEALKLAFKPTTSASSDMKHSCAIGSVKTNIGHLDAAAGVAGFIKAVLALKHRFLPPSLHYETPNPRIDFEHSPFYVNHKLTRWERRKSPLRAGVSSFGIGGTNAHAVLEEWPGSHSSNARRVEHGEWNSEYQSILLSAKTETALDKMTRNLAEHFKKNPGINLADAAYTLQLGRKAFQYRKAFVCSTNDMGEAVGLLSRSSGTTPSHFCKNENPPVVFMFPGLGSQYVNMGLELYRTGPVFRREMDRCFKILDSLLDFRIKTILYPDLAPGTARAARQARSKEITRTEIAQPLLFIFEYALARLLMKWGIKPAAMIGYSSSEYVAACISGVLSMEDALKLVVLRGKLLKKVPRGTMLSVPLTYEKLKPLLEFDNRLTISVDNGPTCIVSGPTAAVGVLKEQLKPRGYIGMEVKSLHAGHSHMMGPILSEMEELIGRFPLKEPGIPYISNLTGTWISGKEAVDPEYWAKHMRETVQFAGGLKELFKKENAVFVEVGPSKMLINLATQQANRKPAHRFINLIPHPNEKVSETRYFLNRIGQLWTYGVKIDWARFHDREERERIPLPTYPFKKQRYRIEGDPMAMAREWQLGQTQGRIKADIKDWFYIPSWKRLMTPAGKTWKTTHATWLVFVDDTGLGEQLVRELERENQLVITVKKGTAYQKEGENLFKLDPLKENGRQYETLFAELEHRQMIPGRIVNLWALTKDEAGKNDWQEMPHAEKNRELGYYSLIDITQAIGKRKIAAEIRLIAVTNNMQEVIGREMWHPEKVTVLGPVKVIPLEYANINCRSIDIDLSKINNRDQGKIIVKLLEEMTADPGEQVVAIRGDYTWIQTYEPVQLQNETPGKTRLRERGVYLVTGGLGGIGLVLARHLARTVRARLVLTGRRQFPPRDQWDQWRAAHPGDDEVSKKLSKLEELEKIGAEVRVFKADVTNMRQMEEVFAAAARIFGPINGVIHSAGLPDGEMIQRRTREVSASILAAKVKGTMVLDRLLKKTGADFFVLCSSLNSIIPNQGQVAYVAANAFLDAYANYRNNRDGVFTVSIDWDRWQKVGMSEIVEGLHKKYTGQDLEGGMTTSEAVEAFSRILQNRFPQAAVSILDLEMKIRRRRESREEQPLTEILNKTQRPGTFNPRPEMDAKYISPRNKLERILARMWQEYLGIEAVGIHDDFFELGGDSLKGMMLVNQYNKLLGEMPPIGIIFSEPTISELAAYMEKHYPAAVARLMDVEASREPGTYPEIAPVEKRDYYRLSSAQKRLYFLQQMDIRSCAYNISLALPLGKKIQKDRLEFLLKKIIERYESLRTSFVMVNGEPVQRIHDCVEFKLLALESPEKERGNPNPFNPAFTKAFDLSQPPLIRSGLLELADGNHTWMVDTHHIVADGTSNTILAEDFISLYKEEKLGFPRLQYKDFSAWQNHLIESGGIKEQEEFWLKLYAGEIPRLDLPVDYERPAIFSFAGASVDFILDGEEAQKFKALVTAVGGTLYMNILAALNTLFYKYTGQTDVIIGTGIAGRRHADLERIIGMFVNTLAMRNYPVGEKSYSTFLKEVIVHSVEVFENQDVPFETLVEKLELTRDPSRNPLFDISMAVQDFRSADAVASVLPGNAQPRLDTPDNGRKNITSKFDMTFSIFEKGADIYIDLEYYTAIFKEATIKRLVTHFKNIIRAVNQDPFLKLKDIEMMSGEEKNQVLYQFNDKDTDGWLQQSIKYPAGKTIHCLFEEQVQLTPDNIALVGSRQALEKKHNMSHMSYMSHISYKELNEISNQLARLLREMGVKPDTIVGIMMERTIEMIVGILGILKAGGAYLPIEPDYPEERINYMLKDSDAKVLITTSTLAKEVKKLRSLEVKKDLEIIFVDSIEFPVFSSSQLLNFSTSHSKNLAYIIYTSGTMGSPRGVMIPHRGVVDYIWWAIATYVKDEKVNFPLFTSIAFDLTVTSLFTPLLSGNAIVVYGEEGNGFILNRVVEENRVGVIKLTPSHLKLIREKQIDAAIPSIKRFIVGGEELETALAADIARNFAGKIEIYNEYGPTETVVGSMIYKYKPGRDKRRAVSIGKPADNTRIFIVDKNHNLLPIGVQGGIYIQGVGMARGYINNPELTAEKFDHDLWDYLDYRDKKVPGKKVLCLEGTRGLAPLFSKAPGTDSMQSCSHAAMPSPHHPITPIPQSPIYRTGDLGRWLPDGNIEFLGRVDHQVKIRGYRIELGEIENQLLKYPGIKEAVVQAKQDEEGDKYLCAYIVGRVTSSLKEYLAKSLPGYMIPAYFLQIGQVPLTANGKVDRKALPEPRKIKTGEKYTAPRDLVEETLAEIWAQVLGLEKKSIGIDNNFFRLGGHSLKAIRLTAMIHEKLRVQIPIADIFKKTSIRELSQYIKKKEKTRFVPIAPVEEKTHYPASSAQKRLYILQQMDPGSTVYHIPAAVELEGELQGEKLENAFKQLVDRHEGFRTSFEIVDSEPVQRIHDKVELEIKNYCAERKAQSAEHKEERPALCALRCASTIKEFIRPFDLAKAPLLRLGLTMLGKGAALLMLDMHHIISDGLSIGVFIEEFMAIYTGKELPALRTRYRDYSEWMHGNQWSRQEEWWAARFREEAPVLELPYDFKKPEVQSFAGNNLRFELGTEETAAWRELALEEGITIFMVLTALFNIMLSKLGGSEDIVIGTPTAGRNHVHLEQIVGMFVNTLALRNFPTRDKEFKLFLQEVKAETLQAFDNQHYPFEELVERVKTGRDTGRNPLFDVMLAMQNIQMPGIRMPGLALKPYHLESRIAKFDLTLTAQEDKNRLCFNIEYSTALFKEETLRRFIDYFKNTAAVVIKNPRIRLSEIEIITGEEKQRILVKFNDTGADYPQNKTISQIIAQQAAKTPDHIALIGRSPDKERSAPGDPGHALTYRQLNTQSHRLAQSLIGKSIETETIIGIMAEQSLEMVIGILAILKTGAAYLPIDPTYPEERKRYMLADSGAKILLTTRLLAEEAKKNFPIVLLDFSTLLPFYPSTLPASHLHHSPAPVTSLAYVIYTSGTTGKPRGVMVGHRSLVNLCTWHNTVFAITPGDRATAYAGVGFDASVWEIYPYLVAGTAVNIIPKEIKLEMQKLNGYFEKNKITIAFLPTQVCEQFMKQENRTLRILLTGGDKLREFVKRNYRLVNNYGPTENTVVSTTFIVEKQYHNIPIGKPVSNTKILIMDGNGKIQPPAVPGELCISGIGLARGYLNNPELTASKFRFLFNRSYKSYISYIYQTGDLAKWLPDANIQFLGRIDSQVKIRGYRIELGEIENQLLKHEEIEQAVVLAGKHKSGDKYLCAYIVGIKGVTFSLKEYLSRTLPAYMIPAYFVQIDKIPLTANGKIDRKALPEPEPAASEKHIAPGSRVQEKLAKIWAEVLEIEKRKIGIDANFFEIGGHSLRAAVMISAVHKELEVKIPLTEVFKNPTIRGLSRYIEQAGKYDYTGIEPVEEKEYYVLSSAQKRLYILQQMEPASIGYNIPAVITLEKENEPETVERIFQQLIARHESLRTLFIMVADEPVQKIHEPIKVEFAIEHYDLQVTGAGDRCKWEQDQSEVFAGGPGGQFFQKAPPWSPKAIINDFIRPFDLSRAPLLRVGFIKLTDNESSLLVIDMHHIITDGTSVTILQKEFLTQGAGKELPGISIRYRDYSEWQNRMASTVFMRRKGAFWQREFSGEIPVLELPLDDERSEVRSFEGSSLAFEINSEKTSRLKALARKAGATLYMALLAVLNILLAKLSNQEDIIIGSPAAGRSHADLEQTIGMFVNTLALRNYPVGRKTFKSFLGEVKERTLGAIENQDYPFEDLVEKVAVNRDTSRNPLFDVMFTYQNIQEVQEQIPLREIESNIAKFDLHFAGRESEGKLQFALEYCTRLFKKKTIHRFIKYIGMLIESILQRPGARLSEIEILPPEEKKWILHDFNKTGVEYPRDKTIWQLFAEQAEKTPDNIAVVGPMQVKYRTYITYISYRELNENTNRLAEVLREKGVRPDTIVGIMVGRSVEMIGGILGILKAGGAYLPIALDYPQDRVDYMLKDSGAKLLLTGQEIAGLYSPQALLNLSEGHNFTNDQCPMTNDHLAYVIYTSGSTGRPKGVVIEHHSVVNFIKGITGKVRYKSDDIILSLTTISFDIFGLETLLTLTVGARVVIGSTEEQSDPGAAGQAMLRENVTIFQTTPSRLQLLVPEEKASQALNKLRYLLVGGEAFPPLLLERLRKITTGKIINLYGPTETTIWSTLKDVCGENALNIGKPIANTRIYILDRGGALTPIRTVGELCIGGHGLARGYLNNPELTSEKFGLRRPGGALFEKSAPPGPPRKNFSLHKKVPGKSSYMCLEGTRGLAPLSGKNHLQSCIHASMPSPHYPIYRTGDLARWLPDGNIQYLGRKDQQVKIRGFRVELGEIERQILKQPGIKEAVVMEKSNGRGEQYLCAYIVPGEPAGKNPGNTAELRKKLSRTLPNYMIPSHIVKVDNIPLTPAGKINRQALSDYEENRLETRAIYVPPGTTAEKVIAGVWKEILKLEKVGVHDNFFDLGGNSFDLVKINSRLELEMKKSFPMVKMFKYPSIRTLAEYLSHGEAMAIPEEKVKKISKKREKGKTRLKERTRRKGVKNE